MNRQQARELAVTTLSGLNTYAAVYEGARRRFNGEGISPVASVLSRGLEIIDLTRDVHDEAVLSIAVTIYVRCDEGGEDTAEDALDTLVHAAALAFITAGFRVGQSDSAPEGAVLRNIDRVLYRAERIPLTVSEYL